MDKEKNFVLDTNVILHDHNCLNKFKENDIYIPITVIEELDNFKKGNEQINYNARAFIRTMSLFGSQEDIKNGVSLGEDMGKLHIVVNDNISEELATALTHATPDHRIISTALNLSKEHPERKTILVSKDANLRLKALAFGVQAEDYKNDKVENIESMEVQYMHQVKVKSEDLNKLYSKQDLFAEDILPENNVLPNSCFELKIEPEDEPTLCRMHGADTKLHLVQKGSHAGISPRNTEQAFAFDVLSDRNLSLLALTGTSGTGKTLLAIAAALEQRNEYQQVLIARPIVSLSDKDIGFLPGDYEAKVGPYMQPIFDNINVIKEALGRNSSLASEIDELLRTNFISVEALAYIRGRSLANVICIIDEAQNLTPLEIKTVITRAGEGTKVIFTGDIYQIDSPYLDIKSNGLSYMIDRMSGQDFFAHINLIKGERSRLSEMAAKLL